MKVLKWNYRKRAYDSVEIPDSWHVSTYERSLSAIVNCAQCGNPITFGECYTSHEVHTKGGMGYAVCPDCYINEETPRYMEAHGL